MKFYKIDAKLVRKLHEKDQHFAVKIYECSKWKCVRICPVFVRNYLKCVFFERRLGVQIWNSELGGSAYRYKEKSGLLIKRGKQHHQPLHQQVEVNCFCSSRRKLLAQKVRGTLCRVMTTHQKNLKSQPTSFSASSSFFFLLSGIKSSNQLSSRLVKKKSMSFRTNTKARTCKGINLKNQEIKQVKLTNTLVEGYFQKWPQFTSRILFFNLDTPTAGLTLFRRSMAWSI